MKSCALVILVACLAPLAMSLRSVTAADTYHVVKRIPIPGDSGWDYITADTDGSRVQLKSVIVGAVYDRPFFA